MAGKARKLSQWRYFRPCLEEIEPRINPFGFHFHNPLKSVGDALISVAHVASNTVDNAVHAVASVPTTVTNSVSTVTKPISNEVQNVTHAVEHTVSTAVHTVQSGVKHVSNSVQHSVKQIEHTAQKIGNGAEKAGQKIKHGAEVTGHAIASAYEDVKPLVVNVVVPIVVGAVVTVVTENPYLGVAAASATHDVVSGETDVGDIFQNIAVAEVTLEVGTEVNGVLSSTTIETAQASSAASSIATTAESSAIASVAGDVTRGEFDPQTIAEDAISSAASSAAGYYASANGFSNSSSAIVTSITGQLSRGETDIKKIVGNALATGAGTALGETVHNSFFASNSEVEESKQNQTEYPQEIPVTVEQSESGGALLATPDLGSTIAASDIMIEGNSTQQRTERTETVAIISQSETGSAIFGNPDVATTREPDRIASSEASQSSSTANTDTLASINVNTGHALIANADVVEDFVHDAILNGNDLIVEAHEYAASHEPLFGNSSETTIHMPDYVDPLAGSVMQGVNLHYPSGLDEGVVVHDFITDSVSLFFASGARAAYSLVGGAMSAFEAMSLFGGEGSMFANAGRTYASEDAGLYLANKAPRYTAPGTSTLDGQYVDGLGRVQPWTAHYDQYGRLVARTDYNAANKIANIPDVHHHIYEYSGLYPEGREVGSHLPGVFTK